MTDRHNVVNALRYSLAVALTACSGGTSSTDGDASSETDASSTNPTSTQTQATGTDCPPGQIGCACLEGLCVADASCKGGQCVDADMTTTTSPSSGTTTTSPPDPTSTGSTGEMVPVDQDGDGFKSDVDCVDTDPDFHPFIEHDVNVISKSVTICPGEYAGAKIWISQDNVHLIATGVTVYGDGSIPEPEPMEDIGAVVDILYVQNVSVYGLRISKWENIHAIRILEGMGVTLDGVEAVDNEYSSVHWHDSPNGEFTNSILSGDSGYLQMTGSGGSMVINNEISYYGGPGLLSSTIILAANPNTEIRQNVLRREPLLVAGVDPYPGVQIVDNTFLEGAYLHIGREGVTVQGGMISGAEKGILVYADGSKVSAVEINDAQVGIEVKANNNTVSNNDISASQDCIYEWPGYVNNTIAANTCN